MSDILQSLQNLRQQRSPEPATPEAAEPEPAAAELSTGPVPVPASAPESLSGPGALTETPALPPAPADAPPPPIRGEEKTMAARVPLALHRELNRGLLDAADELQVRRVQLDEALEAAVRTVLRDPEMRRRWLTEIQQVRRERREG